MLGNPDMIQQSNQNYGQSDLNHNSPSFFNQFQKPLNNDNYAFSFNNGNEAFINSKNQEFNNNKNNNVNNMNNNSNNNNFVVKKEDDEKNQSERFAQNLFNAQNLAYSENFNPKSNIKNTYINKINNLMTNSLNKIKNEDDKK